ncbi:MAG: argininosuccinate synthase [Lentisphaeraceae bacterium]|nr:argininosuccinate synthase [Lentisphaeraceae bacterium]
MRLSELKGRTVGMCVSGGLDSKTVTKKLKEEGVAVICFSADLAQPDEKDIQDVVRKMDPCGAETVLVDLKDEMADACLEVIKASATYDGGYWNTTGIARAVTVQGLVKAMKARGVNVLAHGATGRGNDQMRFERYTLSLAPEMEVFAPWRDPELLKEFPGRSEMADYLAKFDIPAVIGMKKKYSTDANLAGLSHEAEDLESLETSCLIVEPTMGVWPKDAPDEIENITIRYEKGRPVEINGKAVTPFEAMTIANEIGGRNGVWMKNAFVNRIIGTKSRGVYEAPGMEVLNHGLQQVLQNTLDRRATALYSSLGQLISDQIYDGRYFDTATKAAQAGIDKLTESASAIVSLGLYKGNIFYNSLTDCEATLYNEADSSMEASDGLNPESSQGYADILSVEACALAKAGQFKGDS